MLCEESGKELLDEIRQKTLTRFNAGQVGQLHAEMEYVDEKIEALKATAETSDVSEELSINFAMLKTYRERCLRIVRAYRFARLLKIQNNYFCKADIKSLLTPEEIQFESEYNKGLETYLDEYRHLDFRSREPPLSHYVQVVPLEDCGLVMSGEDFIELRKNRLYFLKKADIAHLINKGLVEMV
ncbi:GINS complex subunit 1 [Pancytospora philotis]|nr:GINS complex subunit 1 [Pancytospora philotis]